MKEIMKRAWEIAREAVVKFGGKVRDFFAESLRQAWSESRKPKLAVLETLTGSRKHKTWVALITGANDTYKFERKFINAYKDLGHGREYYLADGIYDVCDGGQRSYIRVSNGTIVEIDEFEISA